MSSKWDIDEGFKYMFMIPNNIEMENCFIQLKKIKELKFIASRRGSKSFYLQGDAKFPSWCCSCKLDADLKKVRVLADNVQFASEEMTRKLRELGDSIRIG